VVPGGCGMGESEWGRALASIGGVHVAPETAARVVGNGVGHGSRRIWIRRAQIADARIALTHAWSWSSKLSRLSIPRASLRESSFLRK